MVDFKATTQGGKGTLAVFFADGDSKTLQSTHPTYTETLTYLVATPPEDHDEDLVRDMVNPAVRVGKMLKAVDSRYDFDMFTLSFEGLPLVGGLADLIKDRLANGKSDWERFAKFLARLESNPSYNAKQALYTFVQGNGLTILADGRFVGHKTVLRNGLLSQHSGPNNFIDGVIYGKPGESVRVPHAVGTVVSKRRGDVDDSSMACSTGLHVGSLSYASTFSEVMLTVAVAPEDVVGGAYHEKFRTSSYEVVGLNEGKDAFVGPDFEIVGREEVLTAFEKGLAVASKGASREHHWNLAVEQAEYNSLPSVGRSLYDSLRTLLNKSHTLAFETALADHGTHEEWLAKRDAEREKARQDAEVFHAEYLAAAAREEAEAARAAERETIAAEVADVVAAEVAAVEQAAQAVAQAAQADTDVDVLPDLPTMDEKANASSALRKDLASTTLGHKPLARKWADAGVTEASVRRYRKAHSINVTFGTKVKDALS